MYSPLLNKTFKANTKPVTEGKGVGVVKFAVGATSWVFLAGLFVSAISWHACFMYWLGANVVSGIVRGFSKAKVTEIMASPKMHDYVENMCSKIYKEYSKTHDNIAEFTSNVELTFSDQKYAGKLTAGPIRSLTNYIFLSKQLKAVSYKHTVVIFGDTSHIDGMYVVFRDKSANEYICIPIPAPKEKELREMYHKEV